MNDNDNDNTRPIVWLHREALERARERGRQTAKGYAEGRYSTALSSHGAEQNPELLAMGRMAEIALCAWIGINYETRLNWKDQPDTGFDVEFGVKLDTKATAKGTKLIWPINKNGRLHEAPFDILVLVKCAEPLFCMAGWIWKHEFEAKHQVSDGSDGLTPGTWFMHQDDLRPMSELHQLLKIKDEAS